MKIAERVIEQIAGSAPYGWYMASLTIVGMTLALVAVFWQFRRRDRPARIATLLIILCMLAVSAIGVVAVDRGRNMIVAGSLGGAVNEERFNLLHGGISVETLSAMMALISISSILQILALAFVVAAVRRKDDAREFVIPSLLMTGAIVVPLYLAVRAALAYQFSIGHSFLTISNAPPLAKADLLLAAFSQCQAAMDEGRIQVLGATAAGLIGSVVAAVLAFRRGISFDNRWLGGASALFLVGLASYGLTRNQAWDARHPLPNDGSEPLPLSQLQRAPTVDHCRVAPHSDVIEVFADGLVLDGRRIDSARLVARLDSLRKNDRLLHPNEPAPAYAALLVADPSTPIASMRQWLNATKDWDPATPWLLVARHPRLQATKTLGPIDRTQTCAYPFFVDDSGVPAPATWGELATKLQALDKPLHIAP